MYQLEELKKYLRHIEQTVDKKKLVCQCPFHDDRNDSFFVDSDKDYFYCFGCRRTGDMEQLLKEVRSIDQAEQRRLDK